VALEVAMALVLLAGASLMFQSLRKMSNIDLGFDPSKVLTLRVFLPAARYDSATALRFYRQAVERIAALPGVASVAVSTNLPLSRLSMAAPFDLASSPPRETGERPDVGYVSVSPTYLRTLGIPLKRGREFTVSDNETGPAVGIVNQAFVDRYFANQNPVGQTLLLNRPILGKNTFADTIRLQIVGVAGDVKLGDLNARPQPTLYVPQAQSVWSTVFWLAVRTRVDPAGLANPIRRTMMDLDRDQPIDQPSSLEQTFSDQFAQPRFQSRLMSAFAAVALVLAVVGIYGINAYSVTERRREIGVRMALGATPGQVLREMVGRGMKLAGIGIAAGLAGALALSSTLQSVLVGVSSTDPITLAGAAILLAMVAAASCLIPARRILRVDPAVALRQE
jgi:putative ABC transport system permease protein